MKRTKEQQRQVEEILSANPQLIERHIQFIPNNAKGKPYISVDGHKLIAQAHGLSGLETEWYEKDGIYFAKAIVWMNDSTHPFIDFGHSQSSRMQGLDKMLHAITKAVGRALRSACPIPHATPDEYWHVHEAKRTDSENESANKYRPENLKIADFKDEYRDKNKIELCELAAVFQFTEEDLRLAVRIACGAEMKLESMPLAFVSALKERLSAGPSDEEKKAMKSIKGTPEELLEKEWVIYSQKEDGVKSIFQALEMSSIMGAECVARALASDSVQ